MTGRKLVRSIKVVRGEVKDFREFFNKNQLTVIRHCRKHQIGQVSQRSNSSVFPIRDIVFGKSQFGTK